MNKLPTGWEFLNIEDIAEVKGGKRLPKGYFLQEEPNSYPYITVSDMKIGGVSTENIKYVPEEIADKIKNYRISKDDLFISVAGTLGIVGKVPNELDNANLTENADKITNIKINREYLYQVLISDIVQKEIEKEKTTNAQPKLALTRIKKFCIPVPTNEKEQRKIALVLSTWDKAIELKEKLIEHKKEQKKGLMQKLLTGEIRLAGFEGEWNEKRLSEIFKITSGKSKSSYIEQNGKYFIVDMGAISTEGKLITKKKTNINSDLLNLGDLVMAKDDIGGGNIIGKVVYIDENNKYILGDHVYKLECLEGDSRFLAYLINSYPINMDFRRKATGTAQKGLGRKDVENQIIKVPNYEEQKAISQIITSVDKEIQLQLKELNELKIQKKGLMQLLLTGKVRVQV
jgi:type I restriction enzyme S subunit